MGNMCFSKKKNKDKGPSKHPAQPKPIQNIPAPKESTEHLESGPLEPSPQPGFSGKEIETSNIRKTRNTNLPSKKQTVDSLRKIDQIAEKETNISKNDYSFAKVTKTSNNQFSFEVYGEDVSALNPKFLLDNLRNISNNSKVNISRNELLLLTEENQEILKFLSANNITHKDLINGLGKEHNPGSFALDDKLRINNVLNMGKPLYFRVD